MAVQLLPSAPGTRPYKGGWGDFGQAVASGLESYRTTKESVDAKALKNLLLRGQLTGQVGTPTDPESRALKRIGITDPSTIHPTAFSQKLAEVTNPETMARIQAMNRTQQQLMGIKVPDPVKERSNYLSSLDRWNKNAKAMGLPDPVPPPAMRLEWEKHFGEPYPTQTVQDPTTGQTLSKPVPYHAAAETTPEKIQSKVFEMIRMATKPDMNTGQPALGPEAARGLVESQLTFLLGENWQARRPDVAAMVNDTYRTFGWTPHPYTPPTDIEKGYHGPVPASPSPVTAFMEGLLGKMGNPAQWAQGARKAAPALLGQVRTVAPLVPHAKIAAPTNGTSPDGQTATNPKTGQRVVYRGGRWQPLTN